MIDPTPDDFSRLAELLHPHGGLEGLAHAAAADRIDTPGRCQAELAITGLLTRARAAAEGRRARAHAARRLLGTPTRRQASRSKEGPS